MQTYLPQPAFQQGFVLIVEPLAETRIRIAKALQRAGMRVVAVGSGFEALDVAQGLGGPALAIIELALPDISGLELTTKLNRIAHCPVILLTYDNDPKLAAELLSLVAEDVVRKPFDERELTARAYRVILREARRMAPPTTLNTKSPPRRALFRTDVRTVN